MSERLTRKQIAKIQARNTADYLAAQTLNQSGKPDLADTERSARNLVQRQNTQDYLTAAQRNSISPIGSLKMIAGTSSEKD